MASHYESEITKFINEYKRRHSDTEQRQREGRALLWDKNLDPELLENYRAGRLCQPPYVYQTDDLH